MRRRALPIAEVWRRALERGACVLGERGLLGCDGFQYLAQRLGPDGSEDAARAVEFLVRELEVGLLDETEPVEWLRKKAIARYRLVLPLWVAGSRAPRDALADLALRHVGPGDPEGPKVLRTPSACPGECVTYGNLPDALMAADGDTLIVTEGWADYLVMRAGGQSRAVVGLFSASTADGFARALVGEAAMLRREGVAGFRELVFVCQSGEAANARAYDRIHASLAAAGIRPRIKEFDPSGCEADS
ncbi:MAG: hypothetical protein ACF8XB_03515 [Planctomycetota bacterium JB042]